MSREPSPKLRALIHQWLAEAKEQYPFALNAEGSGVMICGSIGGAAYIHTDGTVEVEPWDDFPENPWHSIGAPIAALVMGMKRRPELAELLPERPATAADCPACHATGWVSVGASLEIICATCNGLGWAD